MVETSCPISIAKCTVHNIYPSNNEAFMFDDMHFIYYIHTLTATNVGSPYLATNQQYMAYCNCIVCLMAAEGGR